MSEPLLETARPDDALRRRAAVDHVNFSLRRGRAALPDRPERRRQEHLLQVLTGQLRLTTAHGRVLFRGQDITGWRAYEIARLGIGIKTQVPSVFNGLTVEENSGWRRAASARASAPQADASPRSIAADVGSTAIARRLVGELAHGQRQLVELGMVLAQRARADPARRARRRHDRRGGRPARRASSTRSTARRPSSWSSTTCSSSACSAAGHRVPPGRDPARGPVDEVLADAKVRDVYLGSRAQMSTDDRSVARDAATVAVGTSDVVLDVAGLRAGYGHVPVLHGVDFAAARGRGGRHPRPQRHGQDHAPEDADRPAAGDRRPHLDRRRRRHADEGARAQPARHRLRAAGPRHPAGPDRAREPAPGVDARLGRRPRPRRSSACSTTLPRLRALLDRTGGALSGGEQQILALGRACAGAVAAPARRADRGHPAVDRPGDRRDPRRPAQARQAVARSSSSRTSTSCSTSPTASW